MASLTWLPVNVPGGHDGGPLAHDYYKRAVYRGAPRRFEVDSLPPTKFGKAYYFGLKIIPILGDTVSIKSACTNSEYEIWRRWEDCLWFQDILELRYGIISREKRQRLAAGKGVKKNGLYIHDHAASFESLPPGPDPKSVAKNIHEYLPKLTKRGTLFRPSQATVDQRQKEFIALIKAFFQKDVPSLVLELRDDRNIRDFFGYWRRDYDLAHKRKGKRPLTALDSTGIGSVMSSYFSASNISLSATPQTPISPLSTQTPRSPSHQRPNTADSIVSSSDTKSAFSSPSPTFLARCPPSSAPPRIGPTFRDSPTSEGGQDAHRRKRSISSSNYSGFSLSSLAHSSHTVTSRPRADSHVNTTLSSSRPETFNVTSDFPLFLSSSTRDLIPSPRPAPHSPTYATPGLGTLLEDTELGSSIPALPPTPRSRKESSVHPDRTNRNCRVWHDPDEASSSDGDILDRELLTPVDGTTLNVTLTNSTSTSSLPSSVALSNLSLHSRRSSWRTSSELVRPGSAGSNGSRIELDLPLMACTDVFSKPGPISTPMSVNSSLGMRRSLSGRRPRSLSLPQPYLAPAPTDVGDGGWSDLGEDFIDAYFSGPEPFSIPNDEDSLAHYDAAPSNLPLDILEDPLESPFSASGLSTHRQEVDYSGRSPGAFHLPWTTSSSSQPPSPQAPFGPAPVVPGDGTLVVKAALDNAIVVFRARRDIALTELRQRVYDKFVRTEGLPLRSPFALAYVPPAVGASGKRASTISSTSAASADLARALPLRNEGEWVTAVAGCGSKITLRVSYPTSQ
ncbi:hypothetical protein B0F90DRAFT_1309664 [Multifurca ochricompacta]|uniref:PX domain-containing protein n=1 Tax=Multifurca ochricompacta TaxID=376703 RepID=A0AAD4M8S9_9AGAM|nr:hypothetical protein B0F90DRAFT_1309664 [Multifurca ochricompacta]